MNIKLYNTTSPRNKLNKTLNLVADIDGESRIEMDEHTPNFILSSGHFTGVKGSNYMYCTDTGKYYYIENYRVENQTVRIIAKVDVLMTYKTQILSNTCTVAKNENGSLSDSYLYDDNYKIDAYSNIVTKAFPNGFTDESMILLTTG